MCGEEGEGPSTRYPVLGITPACAGKSIFQGPGGGREEDHPRMCGEESTALSVMGAPQGSPPHVRARAPRTWYQASLKGITPACAGKRSFSVTLRGGG